MPTIVIAAILTIVAAGIIGLFILAVRGSDRREPEHQGWEAAPEELNELVDELHHPAEADELLGEQPADEDLVPVVVAEYRGRHHEDTVEIVPATYRPVIGRRHIAAVTDTQQFEAVDA